MSQGHPRIPWSRDPVLVAAGLLFLLVSLHFAEDLAHGDRSRLGTGPTVLGGFFLGFLLFLVAAAGLHWTRGRPGTALVLVAGLLATFLLTAGHLLGLEGDDLATVADRGGPLAVWVVLVGIVVALVTAFLAAGALRRSRQS